VSKTGAAAETLLTSARLAFVADDTRPLGAATLARCETGCVWIRLLRTDARPLLVRWGVTPPGPRSRPSTTPRDELLLAERFEGFKKTDVVGKFRRPCPVRYPGVSDLKT
jgi:hypothetical protein